MKKTVIGILAHVDAGKTTLSESLLYNTGVIRKIGRVDNKDTFLDTSYMEKARGITIFSKQAILEYKDTKITLMDTPGHVDFSAEMERTLRILDYAILVVSGLDGVQCHTKTLWELLDKYNIPTFIFVNKMDQQLADKEKLLQDIEKKLSSNCIDFSAENKDEFYEKAAMADENALESYLETGKISEETIKVLIKERKIFPCLFGSALKNEGVVEFLDAIDAYCLMNEQGEEFGAYVFKISRDEQGNRLTHMKITGGTLKPKELIGEEKVNQIRIYSGNKYEAVNEAGVYDVCEVTGLNNTYCGMSLGTNDIQSVSTMVPVLNYKLIINDGTDLQVVYAKICQLEEEEPELNVTYNELLKEIFVQVCGKVQMEILKQQLQDRFGIDVDFGKGKILYRETIKNTVMGVGHFEPLRHYSEVHVLLEPLEEGSGIVVENNCSEDILEKSWQKVVMSCLKKIRHKGVLIGAPVTDIKITLLAGRAHKKHTEGGDFRQSSIRAVRQGLMQAESVILEPVYNYILELPEGVIGRAINDIQNMAGTFSIENTANNMSVLTGMAPVATMYDYQSEVAAYSKGEGKLFLTPGGYRECHNASQVKGEIAYNPLADISNPVDSVFCANGAGYIVPYDEVFEHMHVENTLKPAVQETVVVPVNTRYEEEFVGVEEIDAIIEKTFYANKKDKSVIRNGVIKRKFEDISSYSKSVRNTEKLEKYLLVDGYNIIFAWKELKELSKLNMDAAKGKLLDILCNYQAVKKCNLMVVFDAYKVPGQTTKVSQYNNISVVYTKEAQTADQYIERFAHEHSKKYDITVATSDGLEQVIIRGQGCKLFSAKEFEEEVEATMKYLRDNYLS